MSSWKVHISGDKSELHFIFNITGRFTLPLPDEWPVRLNLDFTDHVDAFWFIQFLSRQLPATLRPLLSTKIGDNIVHSEVKHD
ncbi:hypothetical protein [Aggregatibacter actinomycetemcomitans]|uniref:hypothetical protein n=1 Tax=Aggregatibacter actinomycetemcomitans TaxID=714 RepID=UPI00197B46B2|nr:hypothetical protein [Aggregatibacter actinomycetemcomitans]MBN6058676.1 hypothetical protein [Aggregatibacter actinomycetemcomitans]MBN6087185.1 hypothetical protein [Aggregatibacter actinomycetemcomitans]